MDAFLAALSNGGDAAVGDVLKLLPASKFWTDETRAATGKHLAALRGIGRHDLADVVESFVPGLRRDAEEPASKKARVEAVAAGEEDELSESESESDADESDSDSSVEAPDNWAAVRRDVAARAGLPPEAAKDPRRWQLHQDRLAAEKEAADRLAAALSKQHVCQVASRFFTLTDRRDKEEGTKCEVWGVCAAVAEVLGLKAARDLACNGTHYKAAVQQFEILGRFVAGNSRWMQEHGFKPDTVPFWMAKNGSYESAEPMVQEMRKTRMRLIRYMAETDGILKRLQDDMYKLDRARECDEDILEIVRSLDVRSRGKGDSLKLGCKKVSDEDTAFAAAMLPPAQGFTGKAADEARKVRRSARRRRRCPPRALPRGTHGAPPAGSPCHCTPRSTAPVCGPPQTFVCSLLRRTPRTAPAAP